MATWITLLDEPPRPTPDGAPPVRVAVKDAIDVVGVPTTAGCPQVAATAGPALADAACLAGFRAAGAHLVGKANLHELCLGVTGINAWSGTPVNPLDPARIPGGSSSGSAVAVAAGEVEVALGTDTGGSIRIPAAANGIVGLKTTFGRVPTEGCWPLSGSLDTIGPMAPDVAGVVRGMALLEPGFTADVPPAVVVGRLRLGPDVPVDPAVDAAVDAALAATGIEVVDVHLPGWRGVDETFLTLVLGEMWRAVGPLLPPDRHPDLSSFPASALRFGQGVTDDVLAAARRAQLLWREEVLALFDRVEVVALPSLPCATPTLDEAEGLPLTDLTSPGNVAGVPGLSLPVPLPGSHLPSSLQLLGPHDAEALLCATAAVVEAAVA